MELSDFQLFFETLNRLKLSLSQIVPTLLKERELIKSLNYDKNREINSSSKLHSTGEEKITAQSFSSSKFEVKSSSDHFCRDPFCSYSCGGSGIDESSSGSDIGIFRRRILADSMQNSNRCEIDQNICRGISRTSRESFEAWSIPSPLVCNR